MLLHKSFKKSDSPAAWLLTRAPFAAELRVGVCAVKILTWPRWPARRRLKWQESRLGLDSDLVFLGPCYATCIFWASLEPVWCLWVAVGDSIAALALAFWPGCEGQAAPPSSGLLRRLFTSTEEVWSSRWWSESMSAAVEAWSCN